MPRRINSFEEFHKLVPLIIRKVNSDPELAIRGAANPVLAFEEMGFKLTQDVKKEVDHRIRFSGKERKELSDMKEEIQNIAGKEIDPLSEKSVEKFLFKDLRIKKPPFLKSLALPEPFIARVQPGEKGKVSFEDPLTAIKSDHPAVQKLQQYRKLYLSKPGFASKELYEKLKSGEVRLPVRNIKIRTPENHHLREEVDHA
jgi:hypothetical protein